MDPAFWRERWAIGQIGFHLTKPNPRLVEHADAVLTPAVKRVLVPLCGKSVDLAYLAATGREVVGVELVESAAQQFFAEHGVAPDVSTVGPFTKYAHGSIAIFVGDFFAATPSLLGGAFELAYDRASMIALPPDLRERYLSTLRGLLAPGASVLLVLFAFDAPGGPPFSIEPDEARARYPDATVTELGRVDLVAESPNILARGATRIDEITLSIRLPSGRDAV